MERGAIRMGEMVRGTWKGDEEGREKRDRKLVAPIGRSGVCRFVRRKMIPLVFRKDGENG